MSNRLSGPYYGRQSSGDYMQQNQTENRGSFKVLSTSLETPYDVARNRQSQIQLDGQNLRSPQSNINLHDTQQFEVLKDTSRIKKSDYQVKLVVVGDGGCGKTCLLISYSRGEFPTAYVPTIFENYITYVENADGKNVELALWDTAGQEEYDRLRPLSYQNVNVILVCYSVGSLISLNNVKEKWAPEIQHFCPNVSIILVGTKSDLFQDREFLLSNSQTVDYQDAEVVSKLIGAKYHIRCSAKTTENINQVFNLAVNVGLEDSYYSNTQPKKSFKDKLKLKRNNDDDEFRYDEYGGGNNVKRRYRKHRCIIL